MKTVKDSATCVASMAIYVTMSAGYAVYAPVRTFVRRHSGKRA